MMEVRKSNNARLERRSFSFALRSEGRSDNPDKRVVRGHGAVFNSRSQDLGGFVEEIAEGAFDNALKDGVSDIRALIDHNPSLILARTSSGTLKVYPDEKGLAYEFELPDTSYARDLAVNLDNGNITQSSFAMTVARDRWEELEDGTILRTILEVEQLFDVSPVTYPAYTEADVRIAKRSLNEFQESKQTPTVDYAAIRRRQLQINVNEAGLTGHKFI